MFVSLKHDLLVADLLDRQTQPFLSDGCTIFKLPGTVQRCREKPGSFDSVQSCRQEAGESMPLVSPHLGPAAGESLPATRLPTPASNSSVVTRQGEVMHQPLESNDPVSAEHLTPPRTVHTSKTFPATNVNQAKLGAPVPV